MTTRINLLPWREERRVRQQRSFITLIIGMILFAAAGVLMAHLYVATLIEHQEARNQYLRNEIARLKRVEKEIQEMERAEEQLKARLAAIQQLQRSRPEMVRMFDELVRKIPEDVFITSLATAGNKLTLKGTARTNNVVSDFMREIEGSEVFGEPALRVVENRTIAENVVASKFELSVNRAKLNKGEDDEGDDS